MQTKGVEIVCAAHHTGVSHMEPVSQWTVERRDWSKPDGQRTTLLGTFTERDTAHACARDARKALAIDAYENAASPAFEAHEPAARRIMDNALADG